MTQHKLKRRITDMYKDDYSNEDDCAYYTEIYLKTEADAVIAEYAAHEQRLASALREIHATVKGECPSLLDEDSGGNARLDLEIESLLTEQEKP